MKFLLALLLISAPASADWEGKVRVDKSSDPDHESRGTIHYKADHLRVDLDAESRTPLLSVLILNVKTGKVLSLMPAQKMVVEMSIDRAPIQVPLCAAGDFDGCLQKSGFKVVRSEAFGGHPCSVYQGTTHGRGGDRPATLWRPKDLKDVLFLKVVSGDAANHTTVEISDVDTGKAQDDALFVAPADYHSLGNVSDLIQSLTPPSN